MLKHKTQKYNPVRYNLLLLSLSPLLSSLYPIDLLHSPHRGNQNHPSKIQSVLNLSLSVPPLHCSYLCRTLLKSPANTPLTTLKQFSKLLHLTLKMTREGERVWKSAWLQCHTNNSWITVWCLRFQNDLRQ